VLNCNRVCIFEPFSRHQVPKTGERTQTHTVNDFILFHAMYCSAVCAGPCSFVRCLWRHMGPKSLTKQCRYVTRSSVALCILSLAKVMMVNVLVCCTVHLWEVLPEGCWPQSVHRTSLSDALWTSRFLTVLPHGQTDSPRREFTTRLSPSQPPSPGPPPSASYDHNNIQGPHYKNFLRLSCDMIMVCNISQLKLTI